MTYQTNGRATATALRHPSHYVTHIRRPLASSRSRSLAVYKCDLLHAASRYIYAAVRSRVRSPRSIGKDHDSIFIGDAYCPIPRKKRGIKRERERERGTPLRAFRPVLSFELARARARRFVRGARVVTASESILCSREESCATGERDRLIAHSLVYLYTCVYIHARRVGPSIRGRKSKNKEVEDACSAEEIKREPVGGWESRDFLRCAMRGMFLCGLCVCV